MLKITLLAVMAAALVVAPQESATKKAAQEPATKKAVTAVVVDNLKDVKCCMMTKKDVKKEQAVAYRDAFMYFCCPKCKGNFEKDPAKFAVKANQQLVQTKQFVQTKCPFSGEDVDAAQKVKIGEVEVSFCCENCVKKVNGEKDDEAKAKLVFGDESFEKGFAKAEDEADDDKKENNSKTTESAPKAKKAG